MEQERWQSRMVVRGAGSSTSFVSLVLSVNSMESNAVQPANRYTHNSF